MYYYMLLEQLPRVFKKRHIKRICNLYMGHYQKMEKSVSYTIFSHPQLQLSSFSVDIKLNDVMCNMKKTHTKATFPVMLFEK